MVKVPEERDWRSLSPEWFWTEHLFLSEIGLTGLDLGFHRLLNRLLDEARFRIRNGQLTESRLARLSGISQPHMHHILMGKRGLQPSVADRVLAALSLDISELMERESQAASPEPVEDRVLSTAPVEPVVLVPILSGVLGPGFPMPVPVHAPKYLPLPRREIPKDCVLRAVRLAHDPSIEPLLLRDDLAVIAMHPLPRRMLRTIPELPRVVELGGAWHVRTSAGDAHSSLSPRGDSAEEDEASLVGVIVLTLRRMRPLSLSSPHFAEEK